MLSNAAKHNHDYWLAVRAKSARVKEAHRLALMNKWNSRCAFCRGLITNTEMTVDHILPVSRGGRDVLSNKRPLCKGCHGELNRHDQCVGAMAAAIRRVA